MFRKEIITKIWHIPTYKHNIQENKLELATETKAKPKQTWKTASDFPGSGH